MKDEGVFLIHTSSFRPLSRGAILTQGGHHHGRYAAELDRRRAELPGPTAGNGAEKSPRRRTSHADAQLSRANPARREVARAATDQTGPAAKIKHYGSRSNRPDAFQSTEPCAAASRGRSACR